MSSTVALTDLLLRMIQQPCPTTEQDRLTYFGDLGFAEADESGRGTSAKQAPETVFHNFTVPLLTDGMCSVFRGEVLGISLFCFSRPASDDPEAREA